MVARTSCLRARSPRQVALLGGAALLVAVGAGCSAEITLASPEEDDAGLGPGPQDGGAAGPDQSAGARDLSSTGTDLASPDLAPVRRDPTLWPFSPTSPWNTPLGSGAQLAGATSPCSVSLQDGTSPAWINAAEWSHPIFVARTTDPKGGIYVGGVLQVTINLPTSAHRAAPEVGGDWHLHIIDPTHRLVDEMWHASPRTGGYDAGIYVRNDLYGSGVEAGGTRAYGGSAIGGLIRIQELRSQIPHALPLAIPRKNLRPGFVWPATEQDADAGTSYQGNVPMGQLVAIPPGVNLGTLGLSPVGLLIARALQDYGAYVVDSSSSFELSAEPASESLLDAARLDMPKIRAQLLCVTNNRKDNVGGGGTRRAPLAPPLG